MAFLLPTFYHQTRSRYHFAQRAKPLHQPLDCKVIEARRSNNRLYNGAGGKENAENGLG